jgi:hypothetical protein
MISTYFTLYGSHYREHGSVIMYSMHVGYHLIEWHMYLVVYPILVLWKLSVHGSMKGVLNLKS